MNDGAPRGPARTQKLSALLVAHNEGAQIAACLDTMRFADEIVVVLDKCTDHSKEIAAWYKARFDYPRPPGVKDEKGR